jgi:hypothetical protein
MTEAYPRQGEVYLVRALRTIGDTKKCPVAVVSEQGPYGQISAVSLARIQRAVQVSIGIYEI